MTVHTQVDYIVLLHCETRLPALWPDIPLSPDIEPTSPFPILIMLSAWLWSDKYKFSKSLFWLDKGWNPWRPNPLIFQNGTRDALLIQPSRLVHVPSIPNGDTHSDHASGASLSSVPVWLCCMAPRWRVLLRLTSWAHKIYTTNITIDHPQLDHQNALCLSPVSILE